LGGPDPILDIERDWAAGDQRQTLGIDIEDVDDELEITPASCPRTRALLPAASRSPSRSSNSNGTGDQREIAPGSVNSSRITVSVAATCRVGEMLLHEQAMDGWAEHGLLLVSSGV
jgi:hypothetical protein